MTKFSAGSTLLKYVGDLLFRCPSQISSQEDGIHLYHFGLKGHKIPKEKLLFAQNRFDTRKPHLITRTTLQPR